MKVLLNNRIDQDTLTSTSSMAADFPLANVMTESPGETATSTDNALVLSFDTLAKTTTTLAGFRTNADTMRVVITVAGSVVVDETHTLTSWATWADWFDDYAAEEQYRHFWVDYDAILESAHFDITLTCDDTSQQCCLGVLRCDRALVLANPFYGFKRDVVRNDVEIALLDASMYRRHRASQIRYTGTLSAASDSELFTVLRAIHQQRGTRPVPWLVTDHRAGDMAVYGGLYQGAQSFVGPVRDQFDFEIKEEV